jgi:hypothetical protein
LKDVKLYEPCYINSIDPPSLRSLVSGLYPPQRLFQVLFPVGDLVAPSHDITPVVCKMLDKPCKLSSSEATHTLESCLIELITTKIDPESWECNGGSGRLQYFPLGMQLVVVNTRDVQKKVADLLANLRQLQEKQDKEYALEMKLVLAQEDGEPKETWLPKITEMQGRWFTLFQGKTVTLKDGSIQDLLAATTEKGEMVLLNGTLSTKEDDVLVGLVIRGKVTALDAKLVRLDLILQKSELDSASRDDIVVVGSSVRSAQRIPTGQAFNHVLQENEDGEPMVWLEVRVMVVQPEPTGTKAKPQVPIFRGTEESIPRP